MLFGLREIQGNISSLQRLLEIIIQQVILFTILAIVDLYFVLEEFYLQHWLEKYSAYYYVSITRDLFFMPEQPGELKPYVACTCIFARLLQHLQEYADIMIRFFVLMA